MKYKTTKYKTENLEIEINNEKFNLKNQGAQDQSRYDFIKDISRLEEVLEKYHYGVGFAIFLTNDKSYWKKPPKRVNTVDKNFRIHEGKTINGKLCWKKGTSKGTMRGREEPITLKGKYELNWKKYSNLGKYSNSKEQNGEFRYLLIEVKDDKGV